MRRASPRREGLPIEHVGVCDAPGGAVVCGALGVVVEGEGGFVVALHHVGFLWFEGEIARGGVGELSVYPVCVEGDGSFELSAPLKHVERSVASPRAIAVDGGQFGTVGKHGSYIDFYEVNETKPIVMGVPVKYVGLAQGVRDGGRMNKSIRKINVKAPYAQIPETLDINVTNLRIGKSIKVGDLSFEGLELITSKDVVVCSIKNTRNAVASSESEEEGSEESAAE